MAHILTDDEAASMLGYTSIEEVPVERLNIILPFVDDYIKTATGKDWSTNTPIDSTAKMLASALLIRWFNDPGQMGNIANNDIGVKSLIGQLHSKALEAAI